MRSPTERFAQAGWNSTKTFATVLGTFHSAPSPREWYDVNEKTRLPTQQRTIKQH